MRAPWVVAAIAALAAGGCGARSAAPVADHDLGSAPAHRTPAPPPPLVAPAALDDDVRPVAYRLTLALDPDAAGYHGEIEIDLDLGHATRVVWLHAADPVVVRSAAATVDGAVLDATRITAPAAHGVVGIELARPLPAGAATLTLGFDGAYRDSDALFAQAVRGRRYVYSDFEPVDARRAFPCFDEPRWKTPWTVTVRAPDGVGVYGNTAPASRTRQGDGWTAVRFEPTPPLPSYLVAVAVGPFDEVAVPDAPVPARLLVPEGRAAAVGVAAEQLGPLLRAATAVIDRPIPFAKVDVAVVPVFGGAMENPGLITIAADFALAPRGPEQRVALARILAHELGHLWFGDQVTLADWREVWLNEGAASWMADEIVARAFPTMGVELDALDDRAEAMLEDELPGAHPLRPEAIAHPRALFDATSYKKGAAVWHGLEAWLGADRFRAALGAYLDAHAWGSVTTPRLTAALAAAAPELPVEAVVRAAVERAGVPEVAVDVTCKDGRAAARLRLEGPRRPTTVCARWAPPTAAGRDPAPGRACVVVDGVATLDLGARCPAWLHPGAGADGYYRWRLPRAWWTALARAPLSARERRDALDMLPLALASGAAGVSEARPLLAAAVRSAERSLALPALELYRLALRSARPDEAQALAADLRQATRDTLATIGWNPRRDDPAGRAEVRTAVLRAAGELAGDRPVVLWARRLVAAWQRGAALPDEVAEAALVVTAAHARRRQARALLAAARHGGAHSDLVALALGRALAALPGDAGLAALRTRATAPLDPRAELGLVAELLADPGRAGEAVATLGPQAAFYPPILRATPWCAPPPPRPEPAPAAALVRADAIAAWRAGRCRAVTAGLAGRR